MSTGTLVVISGFSGSGKGTIVKELLSRYDNYALSVSATTRDPREGEKDGREYFFKTKEEFEAMIEQQAFLEHACYCGNYYGTPYAYVEEQLKKGKDVLLEIEVQGALQVKAAHPEILLVFVTPPSIEELERRLKGRGTETPEEIENRLSRAAAESEFIDRYDYLIVNDDLDSCVEDMHELIQMQHKSAANNLEWIAALQKELKEREKNR